MLNLRLQESKSRPAHEIGEPPLRLVLGIPFHVTTLEEALRDCVSMMSDASRPSYVVAATADIARQASTDLSLRHFVFHADRVLCDGQPLVWMSGRRGTGSRLPARVASSDLVPALLKQCEEAGRSVYFLGSDDRMFRDLCGKLVDRHPQLKVAGMHSPPMGRVAGWDEDGVIARAIHEASPDLLLVALGCPKQEQWIARNYRRLGVPLTMGIGGSLDYLAGHQRRAPRLFQRIGLEWLWRLMGNPRRLLCRYVSDLSYLIRAGRLLSEEAREACPAPDLPAPAGPGNALDGMVDCVVWEGDAVAGRLDDFPREPAPSRALICDCSQVERIDGDGMGRLAAMSRHARRHGGFFGLLRPSRVVMHSVARWKLEAEFPVFASWEEVDRALWAMGGAGGIDHPMGGDWRPVQRGSFGSIN